MESKPAACGADILVGRFRGFRASRCLAARLTRDVPAGSGRYELEPRHRIGIEDRQSLQRFQQGLRRVQIQFFIRPVRAFDELRFRAARDVFLKDTVGIEEKGND